ncbi:Tenascin-X [Phytophthora nicotianae]|uniref:Tenascin-X n=1 Tax=Phytophthora nicotianae TaxID=4792 RepID=A0A0W8C3H4_PHYNI|nr:Tenascin-X [Phytophthora nicotianae]
MKSAAIVSAVLLIAGVTADTTSTTYPGRCETTKDCSTYGSNYACVSVDTSVAGLEQLSMCIPGSQCYQRNFTVNDEYVVVNGIYQCLDKAKYVANNGGYIKNITDTVVEQCGWNTTSQTLCSGHGTCSPLVDFAQDYECKCNAGYNSSDYCNAITSNECSSVSQCGTEGTCDFDEGTSNGECMCSAGAKGNQCTQCDASASSDVVCSGHGTCGSDGVCTCSSDYNGTFCSDSTGTTGSSTSPSAATSVKVAISTIIATLLMAAFA